MRVEELMVGDWVHYKMDLGKDGIFEEDVKINNIYGLEFNCKVRDYEIINGKRLCNCSPIPLTTEILEKNFHDPDEGVVWWPNDEPYYHIECLPLNGTRIVMPYTQYVHQLQQALRLCGIPKEIEL